MQRQLVALAFIWLLVTPAPAVYQATQKNNKKAPAARGALDSASGPEESQGLLELGARGGSNASSDTPWAGEFGMGDLVPYATTASRLRLRIGADPFMGYVSLAAVQYETGQLAGPNLPSIEDALATTVQETAADTAADADAIFGFADQWLPAVHSSGLHQVAGILSGHAMGIGGLIIAGKGFYDTFSDMIRTNGDSVDVKNIVDLYLGFWGASLGAAGLTLATFPPALAVVGLGLGVSTILHRYGGHLLWKRLPNPGKDSESQYEIEELLHQAVMKKIHAGVVIPENRHETSLRYMVQVKIFNFMHDLNKKLETFKSEHPGVVGMNAFYFHADQTKEWKQGATRGAPVPATMDKLDKWYGEGSSAWPVLGIDVRHSQDGTLPFLEREAKKRYGNEVAHDTFRFSNSRAVREFGKILDTQMEPTDVRPFIEGLSGGHYDKDMSMKHGEGGLWGRRDVRCKEGAEAVKVPTLCVAHGVAVKVKGE